MFFGDKPQGGQKDGGPRVIEIKRFDEGIVLFIDRVAFPQPPDRAVDGAEVISHRAVNSEHEHAVKD